MAKRWTLLAMAAALVAGCASDPDDRPVNVDVLTLTVLAPSCGQVQCHSSTTATQGFAFDTIEGAKKALNDELGEIQDVIEEGSMPPDNVWSDVDRAYWDKWLAAGKPGL
jgi:hypothetical protein